MLNSTIQRLNTRFCQLLYESCNFKSVKHKGKALTGFASAEEKPFKDVSGESFLIFLSKS